MTSKINLLITGATGFVGRELVRSLLLTKKFNIGNLENFVDKKIFLIILI